MSDSETEPPELININRVTNICTGGPGFGVDVKESGSEFVEPREGK